MDIYSIPHQLLYFGLMLLSAYFFGKLFLRLGLGESTGQILGGVLVSPYLFAAFGWASFQYHKAYSSFQYLIFLFLGLVAFGIGEELHFERIKKVGYQSYIICFIQAALTFVLTSLAFLALGFRAIDAFIIGSIGVATAPAALFILMNKMSIEGEIRTKLANIVVFDDVLEIIVFSFFVQLALFLKRGAAVAWGAIIDRVVFEFLFAAAIGFAIFVLLRLLIREVALKKDTPPGPKDSEFGFLRFVFYDTPTPSVEIFIVLMGLIVIGSSISWIFHLPFLLTITFAGFMVANFHTRRVFDSLFIGNITPIINLMFFGLIGSSLNPSAFTVSTLKYIVVYIAMRIIGKVVGTLAGCIITGQDIKIRWTLPYLMLPQAGVSAVEVAFLALILPQGGLILQIIVPAIVFFEIFGILISERTLEHWKSWVVGEKEAVVRRLVPGEHLILPRLLREENVKLPLEAAEKRDAIRELLELLIKNGSLKEGHRGELLKDFMQREKIQSTGLGSGIAVPHIRSGLAPGILLAVGIKPGDGIDFDSIDKRPVNVVFLFISPLEDPDAHLKLLSEISFICQKEENVEALKRLRDARGVCEFIRSQ